MTLLFFSTQFMQDPVRLSLPSSPQTLSDTGDLFIPPLISFEVSDNGRLIVSNTSGAGIPDYNTLVGAWWGRVGFYSTLGAAGRAFPGSFWETRMDLISGTLSQFTSNLALWLRLTGSVTFRFEQSSFPGATESGRVRLSFRRFGTVTTLGSCDFDLTLQNLG